MLEVHPPEHPVHGVRDFFLHLFTITVGLLIALGLENLAEWRHHVHLGHQAEANIRREMESNRKDLHEVLQRIPNEQKDLKVLLAFLQSRVANRPSTLGPTHMGVSEATPQDASWKTAAATGALNYIPYDQVQHLAAAYQLQDKFERFQDEGDPHIVTMEAMLMTMGDANAISVEDARTSLLSVRMLMAHLEAVRGMGMELDAAYNEALKAE